jgi:trimeric autotransporter adhesin
MKKLLFILTTFFSLTVVNGQTWSAVGNGVDGRVSSFAIYNGELYVGGQFNNPNGTTPIGLMKWNGTSFDTLPGAFIGPGYVEAMTVFNNELYVGGGFNSGPYKYIARWNGSLWNTVGSGFNFVVASLAVYNGNLYAGGEMDSAGTTIVDGIAKWDGSQWLSVGGGIVTTGYRSINELEVYDNELFAAGYFDFPAINGSCIARWNDTTWSKVGVDGFGATIYALGQFNNELYVCGPFGAICGIIANGIAKWDGTIWSAIGSGISIPPDDLFALKVYHNELYAGGEFSTMDGDSIKSIARYDGSVWNSVGSGVDSTNIIVDTLIIGPFDTTFIYAPHRVYTFLEFNNELYVGGSFNMIGGINAHNIAKWSTPLSVDEISFSNFISIYPNPTTDNLTIIITDKATIEILNINGQIIKSINSISKSITVDLTDLSSGVYIVRVKTDKEIVTKKFIKE